MSTETNDRPRFAATPSTVRNAGRDELRRYLIRAAVTGEWVVWAEFLDAARLALDLAPIGDSTATWRKVRPEVTAALEACGLVATVERTDGPVPVAEHYADLAGLVRVALGGVSPVVPRVGRGAAEEAYRRRMADGYGLTPCDGLPTSLRGFSGQYSTAHRYEPASVTAWSPVRGDYETFTHKPDGSATAGSVTPILAPVRVGWLDHVRTWLDRYGDPVLTAEPYDHFDPLTVVRDVEGLPLHLDGPHPGVWNDRTALLIWRWDPDAAPLPADHRTALEAAS